MSTAPIGTLLRNTLPGSGQAEALEVSSDTPSGSAGHRGSIHDVFSASLHIDIAEVQTVDGKLHLFVGIDRTATFAVTQFVGKADRKTAWEFLEHLLKTVPYRIHTILPPLGIMLRITLPGSGQRHPVRGAAPEPEYSVFTADAVRHDLRGQQHRASAHQAKPSLEFRGSENSPGDCFPEGRPSRADEPHDQGR